MKLFRMHKLGGTKKAVIEEQMKKKKDEDERRRKFKPEDDARKPYNEAKTMVDECTCE